MLPEAVTANEDLQQIARWSAAAVGFTSLLGGANAPGVPLISDDYETNANENITRGTISSPEANVDILAVGELPVINGGVKCQNGYGVQISRDNKIIPLQSKSGGFCLTRKEVNEELLLRVEGKSSPIYSIIKYDSKGHMKWGKILGNPITGSMKGGRRTLRRRKRRLNKSKRNRGNARR